MARTYVTIAAAVLALCGCRTAKLARPEVTVAAAANLTTIFQQLGPSFEAASGIHPIFSFASTAQLTRQIENSAPFDVFAAADAEHVEQLDREHLLLPGSRAVYATGILALWIPPGKAGIKRVEDLASPDVHVIAAAKPELAPYGLATVETLKSLGLWDRLQPKIVYAENINMAKEYGTSKNADAVFTAYSLVLNEPGRVIQVDEKLHPPIVQELGIAAATRHPEGARAFVQFLLKGEGRDLLRKSGYRVQ
jgi:molybdate transport system substrate-binding protein